MSAQLCVHVYVLYCLFVLACKLCVHVHKPAYSSPYVETYLFVLTRSDVLLGVFQFRAVWIQKEFD